MTAPAKAGFVSVPGDFDTPVAEIGWQVPGEDHPDTLGMVTSLATKEVELGRFAVAEELLDDALARATRALGPEHRTTLQARYALAWLCLRQGRLEEAEERYAALLAVVGAKEKDDVAASVRRDLASV